jgi:hypothetical protein
MDKKKMPGPATTTKNSWARKSFKKGKVFCIFWSFLSKSNGRNDLYGMSLSQKEKNNNNKQDRQKM